MYIFISVIVFPFLKPIYYELCNLTYLLILSGLALLFTMAIIRFKQGYRPAKYYIFAFSFFVLGLGTTLLNYVGLLPDHPLFLNGGYVGSAIEMLLLSLGLADIINSLFEEKKKAQGELYKLNKTLEEKVKQRTADLQIALSDISALLDNMRQSVFTVDNNKIIMKPVSGFSQNIFGQDITEKNIFDTVFKSIDKESELYSQLFFAFSIMFGQDDLQWLMFKDYFPATLKYSLGGDQERILKFNYNPLFDNSENLQKIMFVVEDITDLLKLEEEMENQKKEEVKNLEILQELASNKKQDLTLFFKDITENENQVLINAKSIRSKLEQGEKDFDLASIFRVLHTLKGNARIYGLSKISQKIHELENPIEEVIKSENKDLTFSVAKINELIQGTYDLQGITNRYLKSAQEVFAIDFGEGLKFKENIHEQIRTFEIEWAKLTGIDDPLSKNLNFTSKESLFPNSIKILKEVTHSLKGLSRALDENELSKVSHSLEGSIFKIEQMLNNSSPINKETADSFFNSFQDIKDKCRQTYLKSPQFESLSLKNQNFLPLFFKFFELTESFVSSESKNRDNLHRINYQIMALSKEFNFLNSMGRLIEFSLQADDHSNETRFYLIKVWEFLAIIFSVDNYDISHLLKVKMLEDIERNKLSFETNSMFGKLLLEISKVFPEQGLKYFFLVLDKLFTEESLKATDFIPMEDIKTTINNLYFKLKQNFNKTSLESHTDSFTKRLIPFTQETFPCSYQSSLDLLKIFKHYSGSSDDKKLLERPKTVEVLTENITQCQEQIKALFPKPDEYFQSIEKAFLRLKEVPVKYSLSKFKKVVEEISSSLGKKVTFDLKGEQSSMGQDKLSIVQEALLHLIRNSLDHGIETPETRLDAGKEEMGRITLTVKKTDIGTDIILIDDGSGINIQQVMNKAIASGLIGESNIDKMSEKEKIGLIFTPNLSTKEQVSEISGRGVGMDVVKKNIERLGGEINIKTSLGQSTEFYIIIPN